MASGEPGFGPAIPGAGGVAESGQDIFTGHLQTGPRETGETGESAFGAGNCDGVGSDRVGGEPSATETCCGRPSNREDVARQLGPGQPGRGSRGGGRAPPGPPQLALADRGSPHRVRWLGRPGQRESVTKFVNRETGERTGKMGIARRAVSAGRAM